MVWSSSTLQTLLMKEYKMLLQKRNIDPRDLPTNAALVKSTERSSSDIDNLVMPKLRKAGKENANQDESQIHLVASKEYKTLGGMLWKWYEDGQKDKAKKQYDSDTNELDKVRSNKEVYEKPSWLWLSGPQYFVPRYLYWLNKESSLEQSAKDAYDRAYPERNRRPWE